MHEPAIMLRTRRRRARHARRLVDASPDLLVTIGPEGKILDANAAAVRATGIPRRKLVGSDFVKVFTDPEKARAAYRTTLDQDEVRNIPLSIRHASGGVRKVLLNATADRNASGDVGAVFAAMRDHADLNLAEEDLRSIARFPFENPNPVLRIDRSGKILFANPAAERIDRAARHRHAGASAGWRKLTRRASRITAPAQFEFSDGERTYAIMAVPVPDTDYLNLYGFDITDRKRIEWDYAFSNAVLNAEHEASPDGILVIDPEDRIFSYNQRFVDMWGVPQDVLENGTVWDAIRSVGDKLPDVEGHLAKVRELYTHRTEKTRNEIRLTDGRVLDRYSAPMTAPDGTYLGRVSFFRDITAEKRAAEKIREDEAQFRGLVEQEMAGVYIVREDSTIGYVNPEFARIFGYGPEEVIGRPFLDYIAEEERATARANFEAQIRGDLPSVQFTSVVLRRDGTRVDVLAHAAAATFGGRPASVGVMIDITERKRDEEALQRMNRALKALSRGNEVMVRAGNEQQLFDEMCRVLQEVGGFELVAIGLVPPEGSGHVQNVAWAGRGEGFLEKACRNCECSEAEQCPTSDAVRTGEARLNQDIARDERMTPWRLLALGYGYNSCLALPLRHRSDVLGALTIFASQPNAFDDDEVRLMTELASDLSYGIEALRDRRAREKAVQDLHKSLEETVIAIAGTIEARDPYTAGHQQRVARLAVAIAREIGLPESQIQGLYLAGIVHDVGKINLPSEILTRPGRLTSAEYEMIQGHAATGYNILKSVDFPWPIAQTVLQHHERLDGSGYPHGLKGEDILIEARILAVADVVEAMTAHRPYRPALGLEPALEEIKRGKGRLYDPAVVEACIAVLEREEFTFE